jgi:hypothetical protein
MVKSLIFWVCIALLLAGSVQSKPKPRICYSPCTVVFPKNTEEDQFRINYWVMHRDGHPRLQVWVKK